MTTTRAVGPVEPSAALLGGDSLARLLRRLFLSTRPAFLTASVLPVLVGTAWGYRVSGEFAVLSFVLALLATVFVHAASNVLNDVGDDIGGTDNANEERIFPYTGGSRFIQNGVMSPKEMKTWGVTLLLLALAPGAALTWLHGPQILVFGVVGIALGMLYSIPKVQLSARGVGETAVAVAFGMLPVVGAAWLQSGVISLAGFAISIPVALWVAAILLVNEVPDIRADAAAGKRTLVVRLGVATTRRIYAAIQLAAIAAFLACGLLGFIPWWMALPALLLLPQVRIATRSICDVREDRARLTRAIQTTLALHMGGSVLLLIAIVVASFVLR
jgi:1,4-dihydroxy-2-naphthoate polyprenyltransferase